MKWLRPSSQQLMLAVIVFYTVVLLKILMSSGVVEDFGKVVSAEKLINVKREAELLQLAKQATEGLGLTKPNTHSRRILRKILDTIDTYLGTSKHVIDTEPVLATDNRARSMTMKLRKGSDTGNIAGELDVCPEVYHGEVRSGKEGSFYPLDSPLDEHGWVFERCTNVKPLGELVTLLLNAVGYDKPEIDRLIVEIRKLYPTLNIVVASSNKVKDVTRVRAIRAVGDVWKTLIFSVTTKYFVVLRDVNRFTNYTILERLVSVAYRHSIPVVGGASVGQNGHWWHNCYQIYARNYELRYNHEYHFSKDACLYCDHTTGPFLAVTSFFRKVIENIEGPEDIFFERSFLKIKSEGAAHLVCPDVMFHVRDIALEKEDTKQRWLTLAFGEQFTKILAFSTEFEYTCPELNITCPQIIPGMTNPPCCNSILAKGVKLVNKLALERNIFVEASCGTLLGAIKLGRVAPWDIDADVNLLISNTSQLPLLNTLLKPHGFQIDDSDKYGIRNHRIRTKEYERYIDCFVVQTASLPYRTRTNYNQTSVMFEGEWVQSPPSPGLVMRNKYVGEIYRHIVHARQGGKYAETSRPIFPPCPKPGHHNCLDQFYGDGNFQFNYN